MAENFQELMLLTAETDPAKPLPPPRAARQQLKKLVWETVPKWVEKFGTGYKKLELGYNFLKQVPIHEWMRHAAPVLVLTDSNHA